MSSRAVRRVVALFAIATAIVNATIAASSNFLTLSVQEAARNDRRPRLSEPQFHEIQRLGEMRFVLLCSAVALLACVPGLLRGRRGAWWVAVAAAVGSIVGHGLTRVHIGGFATLVALLGLLVVARSTFTARANPARVAQGLSTIAVGLGFVFAYGAIGLYYLDANFRDSTTVAQSLYGSARLVLLLPTAVIEPATGHGFWFINSVRVLAVVVLLVGLARALAPAAVGPSIHESGRRQVERLLERYADSTLAPFTLLDDKTWFFANDGAAVVSYRLVGSVAVVLGAPIGDPDSCRRVLREFLTQCVDSGWTPVFHQVRDADRPILEGAGLRILKIGEEAIVTLDEFTLDGPHMKSMRSTLKRVERVGSRFEVLDGPIDDSTIDELRAVSDEWLAASGHRERTFTVGRFDPAYLRASRIAVVRDGNERIVAFANIVPSYQSPDGNVDLMRRRHDSVNGVMEFLFVKLIEYFRAEGCEGMTLGLAPFVGIEGGDVPTRVLRAMREYGGAAFNYGGLQEFKAKWRPRWEARYIAYPRDVDLPRIAVAITRAGELEPERTSNRVVNTVRRYPFSMAMIGLTAWFSVATNLDPVFQHVLLQRFGLAYRDLAHGEWWRVPTSPIIEPRAGFVWVNVVLLVLVLPLAEWRFHTLRAVAIFFIGDIVASVPTLFALRLAGVLGNDVARMNTFMRDAGPSAGCWALIAALAVTTGVRRWRWIASVVVFVGLAVAVMVFQRLFDVQHLVAASTGAASGLALGLPSPPGVGPSGRQRAKPERPPRSRVPVAVASASPPK